MYCIQCGHENPDTATVCQACGVALESAKARNSVTIKPKTSGLAITSLVLGILSIFSNWLFLLPGILAIIFGHIAQVKIKRSQGSLTGSGLVIGGLITGYVVTTLYLLVAVLAIPAYYEYTSRVRVNAAVAQIASHRLAVEEAVMTGGVLGNLPTDPGALGLQAKEKYLTKDIADIRLDRNGRITVVFSERSGLGPLAGKTLIYVPYMDDGNVRWKLDASSTVARKYWPLSLRRDM